MGTTIVDIISVAFSMYHCFYFPDLPLVMPDVDPVWLLAVCSESAKYLLFVAVSFSCKSSHSALSSQSQAP